MSGLCSWTLFNYPVLDSAETALAKFCDLQLSNKYFSEYNPDCLAAFNTLLTKTSFSLLQHFTVCMLLPYDPLCWATENK